MWGGHANVRRTRIGCSTASVILIPMPPDDIAATVRCGRQSRQSRQRVVEAVLVTLEQRGRETPGEPSTVPLPTYPSIARSDRPGSNRRVAAELAYDCCTC